MLPEFETIARSAAVAPLMSRSTAQQISHRASIGKEFELSPDVSSRAVEQVLACESDYDSLDTREQAIVRAEWAELTEQRRRSVDLVAEFEAAGMSYVEQDAEGAIIRHQP